MTEYTRQQKTQEPQSYYCPACDNTGGGAQFSGAGHTDECKVVAIRQAWAKLNEPGALRRANNVDGYTFDFATFNTFADEMRRALDD